VSPETLQSSIATNYIPPYHPELRFVSIGSSQTTPRKMLPASDECLIAKAPTSNFINTFREACQLEVQTDRPKGCWILGFVSHGHRLSPLGDSTSLDEVLPALAARQPVIRLWSG
jgi:hypothetical protein